MRRILLFLLSSFCAADVNDEGAQWTTADIIEQYGEISWAKFRKIYWSLDKEMRSSLEEYYRDLKRDCFNFGKCKKKQKSRVGDKGFVGRDRQLQLIFIKTFPLTEKPIKNKVRGRGISMCTNLIWRPFLC